MDFLSKYGMMILGVMLGLALVALGISRYQIVKLEGKLSLSEQQKKEVIDTNNIFQQKLQKQNSEIESLRTEAESNKNKYKEIIERMKPEIEKREERITRIDKVQVTSDECKDVFNIIDTARGKI